MNKVVDDIELKACEYASSRADYTDEDWSFQWDRDCTKKFAELMVLETINVINELKNQEYESSSVMDYIIENITVHFGVELPENEIKKECSNKIDGQCPLHNLFCNYPNCEK
jgi:hypothetical protein